MARAPSGVLRFIDTRVGSHNSRYVNPTFRQHFILGNHLLWVTVLLRQCAHPTPQAGGYYCHRHLRHHLRSRFLGPCGTLWQEQAGMVSNLPGIARGIPSHDTPTFAGAGSSAMSLPVWTQPNSRTAWCPGPRPSRNCCPVRWSPLTARRPDGPTTGRGARGPCIWSVPGRRRTPPYQVRAGSDPGSGQD